MIIDSPSPMHISGLRSLWKEVFGDGDTFLDGFFGTAFSCDHCRAVTLDGKIVSALYWLDGSYDGRTVAYIYAVATLENCRGRGIASALLENTHRHLASIGYEGAILSPSSDRLYSFYERLGYRVCTYINEFTATPCDTEAALCGISVSEYATLRRGMLPKRAILQENKCLDFLSTMASFYRGEDFIIASRREGARLYVMELLGNADRASEIVKSFDCTEGIFRTVGDKLPFTMYIPLSADPLPFPEYLGFVFD